MDLNLCWPCPPPLLPPLRCSDLQSAVFCISGVADIRACFFNPEVLLCVCAPGNTLAVDCTPPPLRPPSRFPIFRQGHSVQGCAPSENLTSVKSDGQRWEGERDAGGVTEMRGWQGDSQMIKDGLKARWRGAVDSRPSDVNRRRLSESAHRSATETRHGGKALESVITKAFFNVILRVLTELIL